MTRSLPPLTWFRAFESAARHLSFTTAAAELGLTQSAISQHVRSLELRFGAPLFTRKPRGLALTDAGRRLLPDVTEAMARLAAASASFDLGLQDKGLLTVATSVSFAQWFLAPGLPEFVKANPNLQVRLLSTIWPDDFIASTADVEIRFGAKELVGKNATSLGPDQLVVVAAPGYAPKHATYDDLKALTLIQAVGSSDTWAHWAKQLGYPSAPKATLLADSHGLAIDLACNRAGAALTSQLVAAPALALGRVVKICDAAVPANDGYFIAVNTRSEAPHKDAFRAWLIDYVQRQGASAAAVASCHP